MTLPIEELARRICEANHPHLRTTGRTVPCGQHITEARTFAVLLAPAGARTWDVLHDLLHPKRVRKPKAAT
jgi:hypothetical protein